MRDMTIQEFCDKYSACNSGRDWALANCTTMTEAWEQLQPEWLIWVATRDGVLTAREQRLFVVWCARQVQHLVSDPIFLAVINMAERHANGVVTDKELQIARDKAKAAQAPARQYLYNDARWANEAAIDAAYAEDADWLIFEASRHAAGAAAWHAERMTAGNSFSALTAARFLTHDEARQAQSAWLRANTIPCFKQEIPSSD